MKARKTRAWGMRVGWLGLLSTATLGVLPSCADNDSSLFIQGVMVGRPPECVFRPDSSATLRFSGTLDVALRPQYDAVLLVGNQLTPRGIKEQVRTETMHITMRGAEVAVTTTEGTEIDAFTVTGAGFVSPNASDEAGFGAIAVTVLPPATVADIAGDVVGSGRGASRRVIANIRVFGDTLGGDEIESSEYSFPIDVCYGCLVSFPAEAIDYNNGESCSLKLDEVPEADGCNFGQDSLVDCRICASDNSVCSNL